MTKRARKILLLIFFFIFIIVAPILCLYYQGYRFDFKNRSLTQTGGFFFRIIPKQVSIYLDEKLVKKTDFFFGSALIENLLPKKYHIEIRKLGYSPWEKDLEIKAKEVTEAKNIILFPKTPTFNVLVKGVNNFWFSPNRKRIILEEKNEESWTLKLYDLEQNIKSHLLKEEDVSKIKTDLSELEFLDENKISFEIITKEQLKKFTLDISRTPPLLEEIKEFPPPLENIITHKTYYDEVYYLDDLGHLWKTDLSFSKKEKITDSPFPLKEETEYELDVYPGIIRPEEKVVISLRQEKTLYLFNSETKLFEKFFENIYSSKISPDFRKLVYFSNSEIWVLFLQDRTEPPKKEAGESVFLVRLFEKIKDVFWLNPDYLIFNAGDIIKIVEVDDRDRINIIDLAEFKNPKFFFNRDDIKLYILSEGNLYVSEKLKK